MSGPQPIRRPSEQLTCDRWNRDWVRVVVAAGFGVIEVAGVGTGVDHPDRRPDAPVDAMLTAQRVMAALRRHVSRVDTERGSIALYFAIIALAAFAMLGLVVDGGQAFAARERAADLSTQAARAGADALTPASVRGLPSDLQADPAAARTAADNLVAVAGAHLDSVSIDGDQVTVTVTVHRPTAILSAVGVDEISQTASATATAVYGGTTPYGGG